MPHLKKETQNPGFDPVVIAEYKRQMEGKSFVFPDSEENTDEYARFYFTGVWKGEEVMYDAAIYTLRLEHESELYEIAQDRALRQFPWYKKMNAGADVNSGVLSPSQEEELGMFMAEVIMELEEEDQVKVQEHADTDPDHDFGVSLDVGLNVEVVTREVITKFVSDYRNGTLSLDSTWYSFQSEE